MEQYNWESYIYYWINVQFVSSHPLLEPSYVLHTSWGTVQMESDTSYIASAVVDTPLLKLVYSIQNESPVAKKL